MHESNKRRHINNDFVDDSDNEKKKYKSKSILSAQLKLLIEYARNDQTDNFIKLFKDLLERSSKKEKRKKKLSIVQELFRKRVCIWRHQYSTVHMIRILKNCLN